MYHYITGPPIIMLSPPISPTPPINLNITVSPPIIIRPKFQVPPTLVGGEETMGN